MRRIAGIVIIMGVLVSVCCACNTGSPKNRPASGQSISQEQAEENSEVEGYRGTWYGDDFAQTDFDGEVHEFGTKLVLDMAEDGRGGMITITRVSNPPAFRSAVVEVEWIKTGPDKGVFRFDDDGWSNKGVGTILFKKDRIELEIKVTHYDDESNFGLFSGGVFEKTKPDRHPEQDAEWFEESTDLTIEDYQGTWYSQDYRETRLDGRTVELGTRLLLNVAAGGQRGTVKIVQVWDPPECKTATVEGTWIMETWGGIFPIDQAGCATHGYGTLGFENGKIVLSVRVFSSDKDSPFATLQGCVFRRTKPQ